MSRHLLLYCWFAHKHASTKLTSTHVHTHTHTHTHTCVNPRTSLARQTERRKSPFTGVWFCLKSPALFIVIKVPPSIPPFLKNPQPYIILISTESRERRKQEGLRSLQSVGVQTEYREGRVGRLSWDCHERKAVLFSRVVFPTLPATKCRRRSQNSSHASIQMIGVPNHAGP